MFDDLTFKMKTLFRGPHFEHLHDQEALIIVASALSQKMEKKCLEYLNILELESYHREGCCVQAELRQTCSEVPSVAGSFALAYAFLMRAD